jgi:hypothetical protein
MNTTRFSAGPLTLGWFACDEPDAQSGEYVAADTARALAEALAGLLALITERGEPGQNPYVSICAARAALAAAGWEGGAR